MDQDEFLKLVNLMIEDQTPVTLTINYRDVWHMINAFQLASQHPTTSDEAKEIYRERVRIFQSIITQRYPKLHDFIEAGWKPRFMGGPDDKE
jgi:hypothetical protein